MGAQHSIDYEGGAGWSVQRGRSGGQAYTQGQAQYLGRYGQLTGLAQDLGGRTQAAAQASGALVLMDGVVTPSRRINDSFALVSTGAPDVDVLHENRKLGKTGSSGHLLVPDLVPYQANRVSIDVENLPVDTRLESTKAVVVPQSRSGVVANFQLERYVAATVILKTPDGQFLPPGAGVLHGESGKRGVVGYDGMTFVEDLQALNRLTVRARACPAARNSNTAPNPTGNCPRWARLSAIPWRGASHETSHPVDIHCAGLRMGRRGAGPVQLQSDGQRDHH